MTTSIDPNRDDPNRDDPNRDDALFRELLDGTVSATLTGQPVLVSSSALGQHALLAAILQRFIEHLMNHEAAAGAHAKLSKEVAQSLLTAAEGGHALCVSALLDASVHLAYIDGVLAATEPQSCRTPLMLAAANGHASCIPLLLEHCPDRQVAATDARRMSPLHMAAMYGHAECLPLLLQHCPAAQIAAVDGARKSALVWAAERGHPECVQLLLAHDPPRAQMNAALLAAAKLVPRAMPDMSLMEPGDELPGRWRSMELLLARGARLPWLSRMSCLASHDTVVQSVIQGLASRALKAEGSKGSVGRQTSETLSC